MQKRGGQKEPEVSSGGCVRFFVGEVGGWEVGWARREDPAHPAGEFEL